MSAPLQPGDLFAGRYRIESRLGQGAFATVWLATDGDSRQVALKILAPDSDGAYAARTRARFEREVQALAGLRDPHTVSMFSHGDDGERLYLVFEHVPGRDLVQLLADRGRLSVDEVVHIMRQVLSSLREAHAVGLIHRDIKPQNIRVFEAPGNPLSVKLLDFGIARPTDDGGPSLTRTGEIVGTPRYMSPEQLTAQPLTPASDIYTLGVVAFELLAGQQALPGSTVGDQLGRLRAGHVFSAPELERAGPLMNVIRKMTVHDAGTRFPSAAAVLSALDRPHEREVSTPAPIATTASSELPSRRAVIGSVLVGVVIAALGGFALFGRDEPQPIVIPPSLRDPGLLVTSPVSKPVEATLDAGQDTTIQVDAQTHPAVVREGAVPSLGCGTSARAGHASFANTSLRFLPTGYDGDTPLPLVVMLHSDYQNPADFMESTDFPTLADRDQMILLALSDGNAFGGAVWRDADADVNKIVVLIQRALGEFCVDRSRIFVVGHGDGGRMAHRVSCQPFVTAMASNSFSLGSRAWLCERPVPTLWLHPMKSVHLPADGSENCSGNSKRTPDEMEAAWQKRNKCKGAAINTVKLGGSTCSRWACEAPFEMCRLDGGVPWPGTEGSPFSQLTGCKADKAPNFPVTARIWEFLMKAPPLTDVPDQF